MKKALNIFGLIFLAIIVLYAIMPSKSSVASSDASQPATSVASDIVTNMAADQMQSIENQVAKDAEEQYYIALRQGDKMQIAVQASMVSAAYLQAKDEPNYNKWKAIEKEANKAAGLDF